MTLRFVNINVLTSGLKGSIRHELPFGRGDLFSRKVDRTQGGYKYVPASIGPDELHLLRKSVKLQMRGNSLNWDP
jgi:hypothetical protein